MVPISPLLVNLFMHCAFDVLLARELPGCLSERYAADIVVHCDTEGQARRVREAIAAVAAEINPIVRGWFS